MIENIFPHAQQRGLARRKNKSHLEKTVPSKLVQDEIDAGWTIVKKRAASVRLSKEKSHSQQLEDRVWMLLYRMQFAELSGERGARVQTDPKKSPQVKTQIDALGIDEEIVLAIECKSAQTYSKRPSFHEELGKLALVRDPVARSAALQCPSPRKRQTVLAFFLRNIEISERDRERARQNSVLLFTDDDLDYYEKLTSHLGPAAKYQFLADMLPGKTISGLEIRVPAVKTQIGKSLCYTFPISPSYLLKIAYVSHRAKGSASDVATYQRMISKSRLNKIKQYISEDGVFPTNIVLNFEQKYLSFEKVHQANSKDEKEQSGVLGWLSIRPAFKSAWVIDGQHRLYAYSGHPRAASSHLCVLAFSGLSPSMQARMFIDINAKQKSVKQSLLQELYAELHWDSPSPSIRVQAIISKAIHVLDSDRSSPLFERIQTADAARTDKRCISLTGLFSALQGNALHIVKERKDGYVEYGPLWDHTNEKTLRRTVDVIKGWLSFAADAVPDWWDIGAGPGGGLSMNDGITALVNTLRSVFDHLTQQGRKLGGFDSEDLLGLSKPFGVAVGNYLASLSADERKRFRELRGVQGQNHRTRRMQQAIRSKVSTFNPQGLDDFLEQEKQQTNIQSKLVIDKIEALLKAYVIETLKDEMGDDESGWWTVGVPKSIRVAVGKASEEDDNRRGGKDAYFNLIHYREIALENWDLFKDVLDFEGAGNKEKRTKWIVGVNEKRNVVAHTTSGRTLSMEELSELENYSKRLSERIANLASEVEVVADDESSPNSEE